MDYEKIDLTNEGIKTMLTIFLIINILNLLSFIYPENKLHLIYPDNIITMAKVFLFLIISYIVYTYYLVNRKNIYGYYLSLLLSLLIIFSAFVLEYDNFFSLAVRNIASSYNGYPNPIVLIFGFILLYLSAKSIKNSKISYI